MPGLAAASLQSWWKITPALGNGRGSGNILHLPDMVSRKCCLPQNIKPHIFCEHSPWVQLLWWFDWEWTVHHFTFEHLILTWWKFWGRISRFGLIGGEETPGTGFEVSKGSPPFPAHPLSCVWGCVHTPHDYIPNVSSQLLLQATYLPACLMPCSLL